MFSIAEERPIEMVDDAMAVILRSKTPAERVAMGGACWKTARAMTTTRVASLHPDWSEEQILKEAARRLLSGAT
jgi:hypothetical protein